MTNNGLKRAEEFGQGISGLHNARERKKRVLSHADDEAYTAVETQLLTAMSEFAGA